MGVNSQTEIPEENSFLEVMGGSPVNKVIDFLIENDREYWNMNEISENADVGYSTLKLLLPKMLKNELIIINKEIGKIKLFSMNKESEIVKKVYDLYKQINIDRIERFIKTQNEELIS